MEQAHTQLIAQLNERISAADNTPLYMKFAHTLFPFTTLFRSESEERRVGKECKIGRAHV